MSLWNGGKPDICPTGIMDHSEFHTPQITEVISVIRYMLKKNRYPIHNTGRFSSSLMYTFSGSETYTFDDGLVLTAIPKSIIYIPEGAKYKISLTGDISDVMCFNFRAHVFPCSAHFFSGEKIFRSVEPLFFEAESSFKFKERGFEEECLSLLYLAFSYIQREPSFFESSNNYRCIERSVKYMHENYTKSTITVDELARLSEVSRSYFDRCFKQAYGVSPKEYLTELRMQRVRELLSVGYGIAEAADAVGYSDFYHFCKQFKKRHGISPGVYKKSHNTL